MYAIQSICVLMAGFPDILGQIGDWKNYFTVAQNEEFHRVFDEWNKQRNVPFVHEDVRQSK